MNDSSSELNHLTLTLSILSNGVIEININKLHEKSQLITIVTMIIVTVLLILFHLNFSALNYSCINGQTKRIHQGAVYVKCIMNTDTACLHENRSSCINVFVLIDTQIHTTAFICDHLNYFGPLRGQCSFIFCRCKTRKSKCYIYFLMIQRHASNLFVSTLDCVSVTCMVE